MAGFAAVAMGGAIGACARYSLTLALVGISMRFPLATLIANLSGAMLAGFVIALLGSRGLAASPVYLLMVTGFLGSFTTLSAFSVETLKLAQNGAIFTAATNVAVTVIGALVAVVVGTYLAKLL